MPYSVGLVVPPLEIPLRSGFAVHEEFAIVFSGTAPVVACVRIGAPPVAAQAFGTINGNEGSSLSAPPHGIRAPMRGLHVNGFGAVEQP